MILLTILYFHGFYNKKTGQIRVTDQFSRRFFTVQSFNKTSNLTIITQIESCSLIPPNLGN